MDEFQTIAGDGQTLTNAVVGQNGAASQTFPFVNGGTTVSIRTGDLQYLHG